MQDSSFWTSFGSDKVKNTDELSFHSADPDILRTSY